MPKDEERDLLGPVHLAKGLPKPPSRIQRRLIVSSVAIEQDDPETILFQHTVFCQTSLPYRNPGDDVREWERVNGNAHLESSWSNRPHQTITVSPASSASTS